MKKLSLFVLMLVVSAQSSWAASPAHSGEIKDTDTGRVYLMAFGSPKDKEKINRYKKAAGPVMKKYGAIFPAQNFAVDDVIKGNSQPKFLNCVEFPSREKILSALSDPAYLKVINDRDNGFTDLNVFVITQKIIS